MYGDSMLKISYDKDIMVIHYIRQLNNSYRSKLKINTSTFRKKAEDIAKAVKNIKGFRKFSIGFSRLDWIKDCEGYEVPNFICSLGNKKKVIPGSWTCKCIPEQWEVCYTLRLDIPTSMHGINKFIKATKMNISDEKIKDIKNTIKLKQNRVITAVH